MESLDQIRDEILRDVVVAETNEALAQLKAKALGRGGKVTELMKGIATLEADARRQYGANVNRLKDEPRRPSARRNSGSTARRSKSSLPASGST